MRLGEKHRLTPRVQGWRAAGESGGCDVCRWKIALWLQQRGREVRCARAVGLVLAQGKGLNQRREGQEARDLGDGSEKGLR